MSEDPKHWEAKFKNALMDKQEAIFSERMACAERDRYKKALEKIMNSPTWQDDKSKKEFGYHTYAATTIGIAREDLGGPSKNCGR